MNQEQAPAMAPVFFFTFLPRERNEGFGDVHAIMGKVNWVVPKIGLRASIAAG